MGSRILGKWYDISREVAVQLCDLGTEHAFVLGENKPCLVFPASRQKNQGRASSIRVSEAEARLLFSLSLSKRSMPFAIEAPTSQRYSFKGSTAMSARTDLLVYVPATDTPGGLHRDLCVEFKAHNAPPESVRKDLEKLLREGHDGLWFHVLRNIDSGTLGSLFGKFRRALKKMASESAKCKCELSFVFVVTGKRWMASRSIKPSVDPASAFALSYRVRRGQVEVSDSNGWHVETL